ncbi:uncharacterized protein LOC127252309 isoform X2 [Andrographis paniculata]|uniref:uncharacterized protein LOC127252309 isoform X2 n=1 Tax=Andrographis paniculata TaxID=175694 RepID=UPI0021E73E62|nr:uncharacterized protein LOC127252309 isoform X2 [Andrographis paniculata]
MGVWSGNSRIPLESMLERPYINTPNDFLSSARFSVLDKSFGAPSRIGSLKLKRMGSSSSHVVSSEASSPRKSSRLRRKVSALFCGVFTPKSTFKLEDCAEEMPTISCRRDLSPFDSSLNSSLESPSVFSSEAEATTSTCDNEDLSEGNIGVVEDALTESVPLNVQSLRDLEPLEDQLAQQSIIENTMAQSTTSDSSVHDQTTNPVQGHHSSHVLSNSSEYSQDSLVVYSNSDLRSLSVVSDSLPRFQIPGNDVAHLTTDSSSGFLVSDSDQDMRSGAQLHLDLVSISSNILSDSIAEVSRGEARRNSRTLFWDALSRHSFRRHVDSPTIVIATGLADELESHDRWFYDFNGDLHSIGTNHDIDTLSARLRHRNEQRRLSRSEISERRGIRNEGGRRTAFCASGLHLDGTCSCDLFFADEESSSFASISRIIVLADALFEVLDEIHHQALSLSLSTISLPAPESVVESFPLKDHKNDENGSIDVRQCYICLSDYEEGDKLRVLPCNHDYHMLCIDKWLKEVNRVCPVCRHNVCEVPGESSASNT